MIGCEKHPIDTFITSSTHTRIKLPVLTCPYCKVEELETDLAISKQLNTSKGLRDFLRHEDHKKKVQKLRDDQHVNSYKLERDGLRKRVNKYREALERIATFYDDGESDFSDDTPTSIAKEALEI